MRFNTKLSYVVEFDKRAEKDLKRLSTGIASSIVEKCAILQENPLQGPHIKCLRLNLYRLEILRVWRVAFLVEADKVIIILVGHRKDFYRRLAQRL